jgi:hypothetical protein
MRWTTSPRVAWLNCKKRIPLQSTPDNVKRTVDTVEMLLGRLRHGVAEQFDAPRTFRTHILMKMAPGERSPSIDTPN